MGVETAVDRPAFQPELPLEPGPTADTPPACPCCRGRGSLLAVAGWIACTWCEGAGADPDQEAHVMIADEAVEVGGVSALPTALRLGVAVRTELRAWRLSVRASGTPAREGR